MRVSGIEVNRWRRYGKDRLYVSRGSGERLGWWDLACDEAHPESPEALGPLLDAVAEWLGRQGLGVVEKATPGGRAQPGEKVQCEPDPSPAIAVTPESARPWSDLTTNVAGAQAREEALRARSDAPVRSVLARVVRVRTDERAWRIGADGEEKVAAQLERLARKDPRWRFVHAVPVGDRGSDIDHVVVGPGGVFTLNAKHHPGAKIWVGGSTVMVDGHRQPYVRNSRHEAERAARLLTAACGFPVHVHGVVVTVGANDVVIRSQPEGVSVIWRRALRAWLSRHGEVLDQRQADAVFDAVRRSTTWR